MTNTIETLNRLIETSKDGEYGFRTAAEYAKTATLKQLLSQRAQECAMAAIQLQALVERMGGQAEDSGTLGGAAHRGWLALRGSLAGYTDLALLEEVERGEDAALKSYRSALSEDLPDEAMALVERQHEGAARSHAEIRRLRDQARASSGM